VILVAAVWTRDGRGWELVLGTGAEDVVKQDSQRRERGYQPVDIAAYRKAGGGEVKPEVAYLVVWESAESPASAREVRLFVGMADPSVISGVAMDHQGLRCVTLHRTLGRDGQPRYSGIARKSADEGVVAADEDLFGYEAKLASNGAEEDICLDAAAAPLSYESQQLARLEAAERALRARQDDSDAQRSRAVALSRLGRYSEVVEATSTWIKVSPGAAPAYYYRALARAHLGATEESRADVARFATCTDQGTGDATALGALVAIHLGRASEGLAKLESTLPEHTTHAKCLYLYSRAYAVAARAEREKSVAGQYAERAVSLLKDAIAQGFSDYSALSAEPDMEGLRWHPAILQLFGPIDPKLRYTGVWGRDAGWESLEVHGLSPDDHVQRWRDLENQGYRPAAIAVVRPKDAAGLVTASV